MFEHLSTIVWSLDMVLLACVGVLTLAVVAYAVIQDELSQRRLFYLERMTDVMLVLSTLDKESLARSCEAVVEEASTQEFLEIAWLKDSIVPHDLAADFKTCLTTSKKAALLEAQARVSRNKWLRIQALLAIGALGSENALSILQDASRHRDEDVAYYALRALGALKTPQAAGVLLERIADRRFSGQKIASLLEQFGPEARKELFAATHAKDKNVRFWALRLLSAVKDEHSVQEALRLSVDPSADVRAASCACLRGFSTAPVIRALVARLTDEAWFVRMQAVRALSADAGADSLAYIAGSLGDENWFVREEVKKTMVAFPDASLPYVKKAMEDKTARPEDCQEVLKNAHRKIS